ncbi:MAG: shikimate dehydrogenase [Candidatus Peregrinibacteria bacterium]
MKLYGIVGHPVMHSLSPVMHYAAFKAAGIEAEYRLFDMDPAHPEDLENFCYETEVNNISGFSVTMPYKQAIMAYMDRCDPLAKAVGSVNTVAIKKHEKFDSHLLIGYNTDVTGAMKALNQKTRLPGKRALVLGAGGAARAIAYGLRECGADVHIFNRTMETAKALANEFNVEFIEYRHITKRANFDVVVNTTPVGSEPATRESLLHADRIKEGAVVMDLVTNPMETQLLKEARKAGAETITGERMLLHQAAGQFAIWFGQTAPLEAMEKALYAQLQKQKR